jgi:hypothetical protein
LFALVGVPVCFCLCAAPMPCTAQSKVRANARDGASGRVPGADVSDRFPRRRGRAHHGAGEGLGRCGPRVQQECGPVPGAEIGLSQSRRGRGQSRRGRGQSQRRCGQSSCRWPTCQITGSKTKSTSRTFVGHMPRSALHPMKMKTDAETARNNVGPSWVAPSLAVRWGRGVGHRVGWGGVSLLCARGCVLQLGRHPQNLPDRRLCSIHLAISSLFRNLPISNLAYARTAALTVK